MRRAIEVVLFAVVMTCGTIPAAAAAEARVAEIEHARALERQTGIPGEFERQAAVLLSWDYDEEIVQPVTLNIVDAIWRNVPVILLVTDAESRNDALAAFRRWGIPRNAVRFVQIPFDTIWARDYGPTIVRSAGGAPVLVDADYERGTRSNDDSVPAMMAPLLRVPFLRAPINIEGGNLLSNGAGLCLTTYTVLENNIERGYDEEQVTDILKRHYGVSDVVFLEALDGEGTGHIDMFATFTSADTVLIGQYPPHLDPVNALRLDRNAERLSKIVTPFGPLKVVRIPMPPRQDDDIWPTYTNVLYANGCVLVPVYPDLDPDEREDALDTYRRLLPDWDVVGIDCSELIGFGGAVHCISKNLARVARLPDANRFEIPRVRASDGKEPLAQRMFGSGESPFDADEEAFGDWNLEGLSWFDPNDDEREADDDDRFSTSDHFARFRAHRFRDPRLIRQPAFNGASRRTGPYAYPGR
jgi:agmatine/peptidylarginine deiminase